MTNTPHPKDDVRLFNQFMRCSLFTGFLVACVVEFCRLSYVWMLSFHALRARSSGEEQQEITVAEKWTHLAIDTAVTLLVYFVFYRLFNSVLVQNLAASTPSSSSSPKENDNTKDEILKVYQKSFLVGCFLGAAFLGCCISLMLVGPATNLVKEIAVGMICLAALALILMCIGTTDSLGTVDISGKHRLTIDNDSVQEPLLPVTHKEPPTSDKNQDSPAAQEQHYPTLLRVYFMVIISILGFLIPLVKLGISLLMVGFGVLANKPWGATGCTSMPEALDVVCGIITVVLIVSLAYTFLAMVTLGTQLYTGSTMDNDDQAFFFEDWFHTEEGCIRLSSAMATCAAICWVSMMSWLSNSFRQDLVGAASFHLLVVFAGCRLILWCCRCIRLRHLDDNAKEQPPI